MKEHNIKQTPFLGLEGSGGGLASRLAVSGASPKYLDDVFSTYLYDGNGGAQIKSNGIDLAGEGGMVWIKSRSGTDEHTIQDTVSGTEYHGITSNANQYSYNTSHIQSWNSNGFTIGSANQINRVGSEFTSWTFRKCPGFFDVVAYTGNGSVQNISHSLGSVPGMIIVKNKTSTGNWIVYHKFVDYSYPQNYKLELIWLLQET